MFFLNDILKCLVSLKFQQAVALVLFCAVLKKSDLKKRFNSGRHLERCRRARSPSWLS